MKINLIILSVFFAVSAVAGEHGGGVLDVFKKSGKEHAGEKVEKAKADHGGNKLSGFTAKHIKSAMKAHILKQTAKGHGVFNIKDPQTGKTLRLKFKKIHDPVRVMKSKGQYFACTDFTVVGDSKKVYDLDFWLTPKSGSLKITNTKIHKHPVRSTASWVKKERYTFKDDDIVEVK